MQLKDRPCTRSTAKDRPSTAIRMRAFIAMIVRKLAGKGSGKR